MHKKNLKRDKQNLILFIISYIINNLASGILYDTFVNYLQEVETSIATSFWAFYGYATFISAFLLLLIPKTGYKKMLLFCSVSTSLAFFAVIGSTNVWILSLATLLALIGVQLHFIMLSPFIANYSESLESKEIYWYTRTYYMGYIGYILATYLGGSFVVRAFSSIAKISYQTAKQATRYITKLPPNMYQSYIHGNQVVLCVVGCISLLSILPVLFIHEEKERYKIENNSKLPLKEKIQGACKLLMNRYSRAYLLYWAIISFAMGLFTSYYTIYLNRNLHIDKATSSLMVSLSYVAIVIFMFFTPKCVKKLGKVGTICFTVITSVPFMILIGMGNHFGKLVVPIVGISLFIRAGLANLSSPADSSLSMDLISKEMRPVYTSLVNFIAGIISILSGTFTGNYLFLHPSGYQKAYFIAAGCYAIAGIILFCGLHTYNYKENEIMNGENIK